MTDVHEVYVDKRRWRIWPIVVLILVALFALGMLVAMIMNIHGSITWPAGEVKFGFWPRTTTSASAPEIAPSSSRVATEIPLTPPPAPVQQAQTETPPAAAPPIESNPAPADNAPPQQ